MEFESSPAIYISLRPKMVKPLWGEKNDTEPHSGDMNSNTDIHRLSWFLQIFANKE
jgi:hypothetical protein